MPQKARTLSDLNARRFAIAVKEGPGLIEATDGTRYRTVILVNPLVVVHHFVDKSRLFFLFVLGQTIQITLIALERCQRRLLDVVNRATQRVARDAITNRREI